MKSESETADYPLPPDLPDDFKGRNLYFYVGWEAHANGAAYQGRGAPDWRWGWMEREKMIREAIQEAINDEPL